MGLGSSRRGVEGEQLACDFLEKRGYEIVARNFNCRSGEVDVIARDGATTVFVEVKERRGTSHGAGYDAVTYEKRTRIVRAARLFASQHGLEEQPLRFDVISIQHRAEGGAPDVRHDAGAFDAEGR